MKTLTALIVDDEPLARAHLRRLLEAQHLSILGEAENVPEALQLTEDLRPDLLFLDIQMPGLSGMQAASALLHLAHAPLIIFVTGYSEHAVAAFEQDALDYLVKPVSPDRLTITLLRAKERLCDQPTGSRSEAGRSARRRERTPPVAAGAERLCGAAAAYRRDSLRSRP